MEDYWKGNCFDCSKAELIVGRLHNCSWNTAGYPDCNHCCDKIHSYVHSGHVEARRQALC